MKLVKLHNDIEINHFFLQNMWTERKNPTKECLCFNLLQY